MTYTLEQLKKLCDEAAAGPWRQKEVLDYSEIYDSNSWGKNLNPLALVGTNTADADFITAARTALPELVAELEKVTAERDELKLTRMGDHRGCTDEDCQCSTCVNDHYYCCDVSNHNKSCVLNNCPDYEQEVTNAN